jgi:hypothetical protein
MVTTLPSRAYRLSRGSTGVEGIPELLSAAAGQTRAVEHDRDRRQKTPDTMYEDQ